MAVELLKIGDLVKLSVGSFDGEETAYMVNIHQMENLKTALFYWFYELGLREVPPQMVFVGDDGTTTVKRGKGDGG